MTDALITVEQVFEIIIRLSIIILELFGVIVLVVTAFRSFIGFVKKKAGLRLMLAKGIALALEFKLGSEVLRTVVVREREELMVLGAIILLRAALTFLIHWEIKNEQKMM